MIVTQADFDAVDEALAAHRLLRKALEEADSGEWSESESEDVPGLWEFVGNAPHLVMPLGFDEYVVVQRPGLLWTDEAQAQLAERYAVDATTAFPTESLYRDETSGAWYMFDGLTGELWTPTEALNFIGGSGTDERRTYPIEKWLARLGRLVLAPDPGPRVLWLPGPWTPARQHELRGRLKQSVAPILAELQRGDVDLRDIHWRTLEELVAELLAARGLQVDVTPQRADGGRDIVARGELIPGEPMQIAVEVKQKRVVGLEDVRQALRANEDFPALMLATAGRFSAGVVREKSRYRNHLRLFLKDGLALSRWISTYRAESA